jgi:DnaJ-domain-containing protein 1
MSEWSTTDVLVLALGCASVAIVWAFFRKYLRQIERRRREQEEARRSAEFRVWLNEEKPERKQSRREQVRQAQHEIAIEFERALKQYASFIEDRLWQQGLHKTIHASELFVMDVVAIIKLVANADSGGLTHKDGWLALRVLEKLHPTKFKSVVFVDEKILELISNLVADDAPVFLTVRALKEHDRMQGKNDAATLADLYRKFIKLHVCSLHPSVLDFVAIELLNDLMGTEALEASRDKHCLDCAKSLLALELNSDATTTEIKSAYRDLAKVWHPDRISKNDTRLLEKADSKLKLINEAYEHLNSHCTPEPCGDMTSQRS